jgi:predicted ATPase
MGIFVGRDHELRALDALLDAALAGEGNVALVSGEPGVGKTRLVEGLTRRAEARGFVVAWGRSCAIAPVPASRRIPPAGRASGRDHRRRASAREGEGTPAYYPWLQALRRLRGSFGPLFDAACAESPRTRRPASSAAFAAWASISGDGSGRSRGLERHVERLAT